MSEAALIKTIEEILSGEYDPVAAIVRGELKRGFKVIRPGDAPWFRAGDWRPESVASLSGNTVRLVLLHAFVSGKGAFTRTLKDIAEAGLAPSVIDPTPELAETLKRHGWFGKQVGRTFETHERVWQPKK